MSATDASLRIWKLVRDELKREMADIHLLSIKQRNHLQNELEMCEERVSHYEARVKA